MERPAEPPSLAPRPQLPSFDGPCLANVVAACAPGAAARPGWVPPLVAGARQVVLLVLDGLGWRQLETRRLALPTLSSGQGGAITSVAPSTTATALTSLTTGVPPARHGIVGYRLASGDGVLNVLRWTVDGGDARQRLRPSELQPHEPLAQPGLGRLGVVTRADYAPTGFTAAHLGHRRLRGWHTPSGLTVEVRRLLDEGVDFVYAYYDGVDRVAHAFGLGEHYEAELLAADALVRDVIGVLGPEAVLVVTADHGQVEVGPAIEVLAAEVTEGVEHLSGEGRFRWLHTRPGAAKDVAAAAGALYGSSTWVRTYEEVVDEGWLGGEPTAEVRRRLGDVALVPFAPLAFLDPADAGEQRLVARHGSLTDEEMLVPLLAFSGDGR